MVVSYSRWALILLAALLVGCSMSPIQPGRVESNPRVQAVTHAEEMVGKPYRYGGRSPEGFDCSGLVHYAYARSGQQVPRSTDEQFSSTQKISAEEMQPGDLLFFLRGGRPNHVGLYVGEGRFIHAPSSGKRVSHASLDDPYWRKRLVKIGRF